MSKSENQEERIEQLEKTIGTMRKWMIVSVTAVIGLLILGAAEADRILRIDKVEADKIQTGSMSIFDSKGKRRMFMGLSKDEKLFSFMIYGQDSIKPVLSFSGSGDGKTASISMTDSKGIPKLILKTDNDTNTNVLVFDKKGSIIGGIFNAASNPTVYARKLLLTDSVGVVRGSFLVDENDNYNPALALFSPKSTLKAKLFYSEKSASGLGFFDNKFVNRGLLGILPNGHSYILFNDSTGKIRYLTPENK